MKEMLDLTNLKESPGVYPNQQDMIAELLSDNEQVIVLLRDAIDKCEKDAGTADFLTGLLKQHEKTAWILRRYLN